MVELQKRGVNMQKRRRRLWKAVVMAVVLALVLPVAAFAASEDAGAAGQPALFATFWALVPPIVAIVLALITKEVYSSLFIDFSGRYFLFRVQL